MNTRSCVFLESDEFGREHFAAPDDNDLIAQVKRVAESAERTTAADGITRRVGIEIFSIDDESLICDVCGEPFEVREDGTANHMSATSLDGIDHDADADHVPYHI